jgi:hypothetical protein
MKSRSERLPSQILFGLFLVAWAALCFWAGPNFVLVAVILLLAALVPLALVAGHRYLQRPYITAEVVALPVALILMFATGFDVAAVILFGALLGADTLICSYLVLRRGRGAIRNSTRNLIIFLAALGVGIGASFVASAVAPVPSCGTATVGVGGATDQGSATAGQCFSAAAQSCAARTLTVDETSVDEIATHRYRIVEDANSQCHFTDSVTYGPPAAPTRFSAAYSCPTLTDQIGAPGEQQVQLTQCSGGVAGGVAAPIIPVNPFQPQSAATPAPG